MPVSEVVPRTEAILEPNRSFQMRDFVPLYESWVETRAEEDQLSRKKRKEREMFEKRIRDDADGAGASVVGRRVTAERAEPLPRAKEIATFSGFLGRNIVNLSLLALSIGLVYFLVVSPLSLNDKTWIGIGGFIIIVVISLSTMNGYFLGRGTEKFDEPTARPPTTQNPGDVWLTRTRSTRTRSTRD